RPAPRADRHSAAAGHVGGQVRARRALLHAPQIRVARAHVPVRRPADPRLRARGGADDPDRRLPGVRPLMDPAPPFAWTSGEIHVDVVLGVGLLAAAYARAWTRGPRGGLREPALFLAALLVLLVALNGPLHDLSDYYLFSAHMVQHLLLTLVVPPLLLAGTPRWMADALVRCLERVRVLGALGRAATRPVPALTLYAAALIGWHLPGPYGAALEHHRLHVVEHLALMATAPVAWWPSLAASVRLPRLHY